MEKITDKPSNFLSRTAPMIDKLNGQKPWEIEDARDLYGVDLWGSSYFGINGDGHVSVTPWSDKGPSVDLMELVEDLQERGIRAPMLIRFPDIVGSRLKLLRNCFSNAFKEYGYKGNYRCVYPIKVNQQKHLLTDLISSAEGAPFGIECGSKPELLVALSLTPTSDTVIVCNGFKDQEYIETALLGQKLGKRTLIVVDRARELPLIIETARALKIKPSIGLRLKLESKGTGKWMESSGSKSKFGLSPAELTQGIALLEKEGMLDCLELLHYHIGSQITSIQAIKKSLKEGAQFFAEICNMGVNLKYFDVGGGLGVDYDGSGDSENSIDYSEQEYANDVVSIIQEVCDSKNVTHPCIITEAGRALVAHHSVLVFNVLGTNEFSKESPTDIKPEPSDHGIVQELLEIKSKLNEKNLVEFYNDLVQLRADIPQLFSYGYLPLDQRAKADEAIRTILPMMAKIAATEEDFDDVKEALDAELIDTYFGNFSVFQSVPDSWAVNHVFPVMPIHRLNEAPTKKAILADLTCDSDGKLATFSERGYLKNAIELHPFSEEKPYYIGVFLLGAYQEILGDLHNLFGDTDAVHVAIGEAGFTIEHVENGDCVAEVLQYLQFKKGDLINRVRMECERAIQDKQLEKSEARLLMKHFEDGLFGYTYLEDPEI